MADRDRYTADATRAILAAARHEHSFAEWLAHVLAQVAGQLGGVGPLLAGRPGSWEAGHVRALVFGTVGADEEDLPAPMEGITDEQARSVFWALVAGEMTDEEIVAEFRVPENAIGEIEAGVAWAWLREREENSGG